MKSTHLFMGIPGWVFVLFLGFSLLPGCEQRVQPEGIQAEDASEPIFESASTKNLQTPESPADTISREDLEQHIRYLASDDLEGRFSGTSGAQAAAAYIAEHFEELDLFGLPNQRDQMSSFFQKFQMEERKLLECSLESEHATLRNWHEFGERFCHFYGDKESEVVFVGFGRESDLEGIDIQGKLAAFFPGEPNSSNPDFDKERLKMKMLSERGAAGFLLIFTDEGSRESYSVFRKAYYEDKRYYLALQPEEAIKAERSIVVFASTLADLFGVPTQEILGALDELNRGKNMSGSFRIPVRMKTSYETFKSFEGANVLGFIEGTDKKDEWIIITAHYDHLGMHRGEIYNGADDNASGVAALLEIAHAFALAAENGEHPRRSILFMCPDAEEIGANGSLYYVDHPLVPLTQTIVDVNIDSIGRDDAARPDLKNFVYAYSSRNIKSDMEDALTVAEKQMQDAPHVVDRTSPPGSDNYIFEQTRVPALAFTTGHCADYHTPQDTFRKIDMENVLAITRLIYLTIREIADGEESIDRVL